MKTITVGTGTPYDIHIGSGILGSTGTRIAAISHQRYRRVALITDSQVGPLYGATVEESLKNAGYEVYTYCFPNGEASKSMDTAMAAVEFMAGHTFTRSDLIVALGGGVVGDLSGFVASVYMRGIDYIQIPTSFLAAIDSSVGGKTAVNIPQGKNLVGTFWQPRLVICDVSTLSTLSGDVFSEGVAEAVKYGCIWDKSLFDLLAEKDVGENLVEVIARCVDIKAQVVATDERDNGLRQILNFGHTLGHGIEKLSNYTMPHGRGVAIGMCLAVRAGEAAGLTPKGTGEQLRRALERYGLPTRSPYPMEQLIPACLGDKKRSGNTINLILLQELGKSIIHPVDAAKLPDFIIG